MTGKAQAAVEPVGTVEMFLGLKLHAVTLPQVSSHILSSIAERERFTVTYLNPNYVVAARKSPELVTAINEFDLVLADGIGVVVGARALDIPVNERLSTDRVCLEVFRKCTEEKLPVRIFLLGGRPGVGEKAAEKLKATFPQLSVAGVHHGWFDPRLDARIVEMINASRPDLLLVCMGTPRQQFWVRAHAPALKCPVIMTGGGYLDNLSVSATYYPRWVDRAALNWLWRLCTEPRHVWKRYTIEAAVFSGLILKQLARPRRPALQRDRPGKSGPGPKASLE